MTFNKTLLAGLVALAAASSAQAVTVAANDGWTLGVSGQVNQFATFTDDNNGDSISEVRDGLLPAFISFDMTAPTMNGLDIAAHISFSPSTNTYSQQAASIEQREVYFTVAGGFGQILAGKALGLYGSHNILTEQTLYGVGWGTGGNGTTTLGGIGLGYDYADWRSQIKWTSNDMNGFKVAFAVVDGQGTAVATAAGLTGPLSILSTPTPAADTSDLRYEADLSYAGAFDGGSYSAWLSGAFQDRSDISAVAEDAQYWTIGGTLAVSGFEFMAQYSDAEDTVSGGGVDVDANGNGEWDQFVIQAGYRFAGTTLVSANYSELESKTNATNDDTSDRITLGVYHDVNANLKLVAEYTKVEHDDSTRLDQDIISLGGFVFF